MLCPHVNSRVATRKSILHTTSRFAPITSVPMLWSLHPTRVYPRVARQTAPCRCAQKLIDHYHVTSSHYKQPNIGPIPMAKGIRLDILAGNKQINVECSSWSFMTCGMTMCKTAFENKPFLPSCSSLSGPLLASWRVISLMCFLSSNFYCPRSYVDVIQQGFLSHFWQNHFGRLCQQSLPELHRTFGIMHDTNEII